MNTNAFDKVIGCTEIKDQLLQMCDMIRNNRYYRDLGANIPKGVLIYGEPGMGKTLISECFIRQSGLPAYTVRRTGTSDSFTETIKDTFRTASENAPSIVFLDDMDKFANSDRIRRDAAEYVTVQACMDEVSDKEIIVIATANDIEKLPESLIRPGRFDRKMEMCIPDVGDSAEIVKYYLRNRNIASDADLCDIAMMIRYSTCAELETILNEAAINAAYERRSAIGRQDFIKAVLKIQYKTLDDRKDLGSDELYETAVHEAGHLVLSELLCPGSIGMASIGLGDRNYAGGFVHRCRDINDTEKLIMIHLAGRAASMVMFPGAVIRGCATDLCRASRMIFDEIAVSGIRGMGFCDPSTEFTSSAYNARTEAVVQSELERYLADAQKLLADNREFLENTADALFRKGTLLYSDIAQLYDRFAVKRNK